MKQFLSNKYLQAILRIILGAIFLYAGSISIRSPEEFADSVAGYQLLPLPTINLLALALPPLEMIVGTLLVLGRLRRVAAFSALILTVVFAVALTSAIARGLTIDCGCFGHGSPSRMKMWLSLGRDVLLGVLLAVVYGYELRKVAAPEGNH